MAQEGGGMIRCEHIRITVDGTGAGTVVTPPIIGDIVAVANPGTALGGTADYTLTRRNDGGTVWAAQNAPGPFQYAPVSVLHSGTTVAGTASGVPSASHLQLVVGSATPSASGDLYLYYRQ